jgi:hypothetical protein
MNASEHIKYGKELFESLTDAQKLDIFCFVVSNIHQGEIEEKRSYRGVLYNVFNFGPEAYGPAQLSGYLDLHNSIYSLDEIRELLKNFCEINNIEDVENKVSNYMIRQYL